MKRLFIAFLTAAVFLFAGTYSGGSGTSEDPYRIATTGDLIELSQTSGDWSKDFIQTADISFNADETLVDWDNSGSPDGGGTAGFSPIGTNSIRFTGEYDGNDYAIDYLYIYRPTTHYVGLFGIIHNYSLVKNLGLKNVTIEGSLYTGGISGSLEFRSDIENCYVDSNGSVIGNYDYIGGIAGYVSDSDIIDCFNEANIFGNGYADPNAEKRSDKAAGIAGSVIGNSNITGCFNTGDIYVFGCRAGGIAGYLTSTMSNCYNTGKVTINNDMWSFWAGGLIGNTSSPAVVNNCYNSGKVWGLEDHHLGGLIATNYSGTINHCLWDTETSEQSSSAGGTGKTTDQMTTQSTYTDEGWDFADTWAMDSGVNNGYPYLTANSPADAATPITLQSFSAEQNGGAVVLKWSTASESNNARFVVFRNDEVIGDIQGAGTCSETRQYSLNDNHAVPGVCYTYVLADVNMANEVTRHENMAVRITLNSSLPETGFILGNAYPNPFNPQTVLPLSLTRDVNVLAEIYDLNGRRVQTLMDQDMPAGSYDLTVNGEAMNAGLYVVKVSINGNTQIHKISLLK